MPKEPTLKLRTTNRPSAPFVLPIPTAYRPAVGGTIKKYFPTENAGLTFIRDLKARIKKHGENASTMSPMEADELARAKLMLAPFNVSLLAAVTAHVELLAERHKLGNRSVVELADSYLAHLTRTSPEGAKARHVRSAKCHMKRFKQMFPGYLLTNLTRSLLARCMAALHSREKVIDGHATPPEWILEEPLKKSTVNGIHTYLSGALQYAVTQEMLKENPLAKVSKFEVNDEEVSIFTPAQITKLFTVCPEKMVLYFSIGAFAGLRPCEIERWLKWGDINFEEKSIYVSAGGNRKYRNRWVGIRDNLLPVLLKYRGRDEEFVFPHGVTALRNNRTATFKAMELSEWPADVLRHSFCSYNLRHTNDLPKMISEMGHGDADMIEQNYRNPRITSESAKAYVAFDVLAARAGQVIIPMPKEATA